ncbi:hypothetical protein PC118_g24407, partial [Phytophthora cactorum]
TSVGNNTDACSKESDALKRPSVAGTAEYEIVESILRVSTWR